jgi:hypothetical protein
MARNNEIRKEGGRVENASAIALHNSMIRDSIDGICKWNQYNEETNEYENAYDESAKHGDIEIFITMVGSRRDSFNRQHWYKGIITRLFEVKYDKRFLLGRFGEVGGGSGKIAIEGFCEERSDGYFIPSGINTTKSDYWIIVVSDGRFWVIATDTLRKLCYSNNVGVQLTDAIHDDDSRVTTKLYCIPIRYIEEVCINSGSDIKDINITKILYGENNQNWFPHNNNLIKGF